MIMIAMIIIMMRTLLKNKSEVKEEKEKSVSGGYQSIR